MKDKKENKNIAIISNYPWEIMDFVIDQNKHKFDFIFLKQNKWYQFGSKLSKILLQNKYKEIIIRWTAGSFDWNLLWDIFEIDRTFLRDSDIIENQKVWTNKISNLVKQNINTTFFYGKYSPNMKDFGNLLDMESFWVATTMTQYNNISYKIIKWVTDIVPSDKKYSELLHSPIFRQNIQKINEKFNEYINDKYEIKTTKKSENVFLKINVWENREKYFENPNSDYFNPSKSNIRILEAIKKWNFIRPTPDHYWPPDTDWFAIIRWYNCIWACHYCYLQSYFKSSDIVNFANIDDYIIYLWDFIKKYKKDNNKKLFFYDWDFQDSFWYLDNEQNIKNLNKFIDLVDSFDDVFLELRTKCIIPNISESYKNLKIWKNTIYAITFSPDYIIENYEPKTANLQIRIDFAKYIISKWWKIWIRIDPFVFDQSNLDDSIKIYKKMIWQIQKNISISHIANIGIWTLRIKDILYKNLKKTQNKITNNLELELDFWKYKKEDRKKIYDFLKKEFAKIEEIYICMDDIL